MGWIQDAISRARKAFSPKTTLVSTIGQAISKPQVGKPIITPTEASAGARGQVVDTTKKPSDIVPKGDIP